MPPIVWRRLRMVSMGPPSSVEQLERVMRSIRSSSLPEGDRSEAIRFLGLLRDTPNLLAKLERPERKNQSASNDIALGYVIQKELLGRGQSLQARRIVGRAWGVSEGSVADSLTRLNKTAEGRLRFLTDQFVGKVRKNDELWTREAVLRAAFDDLIDIHVDRRARRTRKATTTVRKK